jgi:hypothetical protein
MEWIEVIQLRTSNRKRMMLEKKLAEMLDEINRQNENRSIRVYDRELIDTDICIVLFHDVGKAQIDGSRQGMSIVQALKAFGLVNHSIWIERQ